MGRRASVVYTDGYATSFMGDPEPLRPPPTSFMGELLPTAGEPRPPPTSFMGQPLPTEGEPLHSIEGPTGSRVKSGLRD